MPKILLAEDDPLIFRNVKNLLEAENYQVTGVQDGELALQIIAENTFELIICDLLLPKVNGYELCLSIKNNFPTVNIPFIALTNSNQGQDLALGLEVGISDYIAKPLLNKELIKSVQTRLANENDLATSYTTRAKYSQPTPESNSTATLVPQLQMNSPGNVNLSSQINCQEQFEWVVKNYVTERIQLSLSGVPKSTSIAVCCLSLSILDELAHNWQQKKIDSIKRIALQRLNSRLGSQSRIIQLAEGYFALILPYVTNFTQALNLVKVAQQELSQPFPLPQEILHLRPYVGMSYCPHRAVKIELLLDSAKQALENAQQSSEDCYRIYRPKLSSTRSHRFKSMK